MAKTTAEKKLSGKHIGIFPFEFDDDMDAAEDAAVKIPDTIHLIPIGEWGHDAYGPIKITMADIREFVQNFNAGIRKGVPITAGHEGFEELPAQGWITSVEARADGLWGNVDWNDLGRETLSDKQFKFFSPEFYRDYEDPQTHNIYRNVLTGGALTKSPYFKELEAVVFSEKGMLKKFNDNNNTMNLAELLAKDIATLSDAEKTFIKEHKAELTPEQLSSHTSIVDEPAEQKVEDTPDAAPAADTPAPEVVPAPAVETPAADPAAAEVQASEKVLISMSELTILRKKADEGAQAFAELEGKKLDAEVDALVFSEGNKEGKILPKTKTNLRAFMTTLNGDQRKQFSAIINDMPKALAFKEVGDGGVTDGLATTEVETLVQKKMSETKMSYSEALKQVFAETEGLEQRYNESLVKA
jgi:phage I-like protein